MRMPLDVRRIDSERYIVQPKIVAAHRATISVSAEHFGPELAMPFGNPRQIMLRSGREVAGIQNAMMKRSRKMLFNDTLGGISDKRRVSLQKLENGFRKPAFCGMLVQSASKKFVCSANWKILVARDLPNSV